MTTLVTHFQSPDYYFLLKAHLEAFTDHCPQIQMDWILVGCHPSLGKAVVTKL